MNSGEFIRKNRNNVFGMNAQFPNELVDVESVYIAICTYYSIYNDSKKAVVVCLPAIVKNGEYYNLITGKKIKREEKLRFLDFETETPYLKYAVPMKEYMIDKDMKFIERSDIFDILMLINIRNHWKSQELK